MSLDEPNEAHRQTDRQTDRRTVRQTESVREIQIHVLRDTPHSTIRRGASVERLVASSFTHSLALSLSLSFYVCFVNLAKSPFNITVLFTRAATSTKVIVYKPVCTLENFNSRNYSDMCDMQDRHHHYGKKKQTE